MCRNIKTLFNFDPPASDAEISAASLQFVRKLSGYNAPSKTNEAAFNIAVNEIAAVSKRLPHGFTNAQKSPRKADAIANPTHQRVHTRVGAMLR